MVTNAGQLHTTVLCSTDKYSITEDGRSGGSPEAVQRPSRLVLTAMPLVAAELSGRFIAMDVKHYDTNGTVL